MATNRRYAETNTTSPNLAFVGPHANAGQTPLTGDPCIFGQMPGVAVSAADANGNTVAFLDGIFLLPVNAAGGNMAAGAIVYFDSDDDTCALNDDSAGVRFGYLIEALTQAAGVKTILVRLGY